MGIFDSLKSEAQRNFIARADEAKNHIIYKYPERNIRIMTQLTVQADEIALFVKDGVVSLRGEAQNEAQKKLEQIQNKQREVQTFIQNTRNSLGQRLNTFRGMMLEEIAKVATELAKKRGATLLLDKAGPTAIGISNVLYSDAAYDLTDEVAKEVNKDKPVGAPSAPAAPAAAPAAGAAPAVSVPGLSPKK
jgi:Skp family chaperone for outer membrane proteins